MKAPFVYFGGKRRVASRVWAAIGDVANYVEPFAGSLGVLLERPDTATAHRRAETVNDKDGFIANFWRALANDPARVAQYADWPVNETDLFARHLWLVNEGRARLAALESDPSYFDAQVAGWWVWGINCWIGSGWCSGTGPWLRREDGVVARLPHLGTAGQGVHRKRPHLGTAGQGVLDYFEQLAARLRGVRVCAGDWSRVVTRGALSHGSTVGIFLDPPYDAGADLYAVGAAQQSVAAEVREWALAHGDDPRLRIVLAGYCDENQMPASWRAYRYSGPSSYKGQSVGGNAINRHRETLWMSPHCLGEADHEGQMSLMANVQC